MFKDKWMIISIAAAFIIVVGVFLYITGQKGEKAYNVTTNSANLEVIMKQLDKAESVMNDEKLTFWKKDKEILSIEVAIQNQLKYDSGLKPEEEAQVWARMNLIFKTMKEYEANKKNKSFDVEKYYNDLKNEAAAKKDEKK